MKFFKNIFIILIVLAGLLSASFVFGAEPVIEPPFVVINEIAWMGSEIEGIESKNWWRYEWLELFNNTEQTISIAQWKIELYRDELDWTLELEGEIKPKNYFLIVASDKIADYDLNYANLTGKFINKGQKILLKNEQGKIIDAIDCSQGWFSGDNKTKQTMERIDANLSGNSAENWQTSANSGGTPKSKNSIGSISAETQNAQKAEPTAEAETEAGTETQTQKPKDIEDIENIQTTEAVQSPSLIQTNENNGSPSSAQYPLSSILIASITAVFSGVIIFFLKNKLK